jgi:hypothetical protein
MLSVEQQPLPCIDRCDNSYRYDPSRMMVRAPWSGSIAGKGSWFALIERKKLSIEATTLQSIFMHPISYQQGL